MKNIDIFIGIIISCAFIAVVFVFLQLFNEKENFTVEIKGNDNSESLSSLINQFMNSQPQNDSNIKNYKVKNTFDLNKSKTINDSLIEDEKKNQIAKDNMKKEILEKSVVKLNKKNNEDLGWVISPVVNVPKYERTKKKGNYCAADFNSVDTCCGQAPAPVSEEYICPELEPYCNGYVAFERWGKCGTEKITYNDQ